MRAAATPRRRLGPAIELPKLSVDPDSVATMLRADRVMADIIAAAPDVAIWQGPLREFKAPAIAGRFSALAAPNLDGHPSLEPPHTEPAPATAALLPSPTAPLRIEGIHGSGNIEPPLAPGADPVALIALGASRTVDTGVFTVTGASRIAPAGDGSSETGGTAEGAVSEAGRALELEARVPSIRVTRLERPQNGHFTFVVMGSAGASQTHGLLRSTPVYTVHVQVGRSKKWILQYCFPKDNTRSRVGVEAPYPYLLLRVDLAEWPETDSLIVHGFITEQGRFDSLQMVSAAQFTGRADLLDALQKWQFRPALREWKPAAVEVLLVIPREDREPNER